jgi:hypothetical protein
MKRWKFCQEELKVFPKEGIEVLLRGKNITPKK